MSKYGVISGPYFPVFGLNTENYGVSLRIQSEYRKILTRNNSVFGNSSRSVTKSKSLILSSKKTFLSDLINSEMKQSPVTVFR